MNSYDVLAAFYDELIIEPSSIDEWIIFTKKHAFGSDMLEIACGSGIITEKLISAGYHVEGFDLSAVMIDKAKTKLKDLNVNLFVEDMRIFNLKKTYQTIVCFNDSVNYLSDSIELKQLFANVAKHLEKGGVFLFDIHTSERLQEFTNEFIEEGYIDDTPYQWSIISEDDKILHNLVFYINNKPCIEQHIQTVFAKEDVKKMLETCGFDVNVYTDFDKNEEEKGDKWFFVAVRR